MLARAERKISPPLLTPAPEAAPAAAPAREIPQRHPAGRDDPAGGRALRLAFVVAAIIALGYGWRLASLETFTPEDGTGYWLGIAGGTMLLVQLAYPLRKRARFMRRFGTAPTWFRVHMILGIIAPIVLLWHCNFSLGATNSNVTLFAMLTVAGSGIVGRYFYGKIHRGLYGAHATVHDLLEEATALLKDIEADVGGSGGSIAKRLTDFGMRVLEQKSSLPARIAKAMWVALAVPLARHNLLVATRRTVDENAVRKGWGRSERKHHYQAARRHIDEYLQSVAKASGLAVYERLFGMWHIFHTPLFCLLVVTGVIHVIAVHLY
jgi:hypothetical protein